MRATRLVQFTILVGLILVPSLEVESFDDPLNTIVFSQLVVGPFGELVYAPEARLCNGNPTDPFFGRAAVLNSDGFFEENVLVNDQPGFAPLNLDPLECELVQLRLRGTDPLVEGVFEIDLFPGRAEQSGGLSSPAGVGASLSDLALSFFYIVRDSSGKLIDSVAVPPSTAGRGFRFVTGRGDGFDVGVAVFTSGLNSIVNIAVHLPQQGTGNSVVQGNTLTGTVQISGRKKAFFLHEVIPGFPETVSAALVEMELAGSGEIYGVALGVQAEDDKVQLSGQPVNVIPLQ